jgi:hypothetical protein
MDIFFGDNMQPEQSPNPYALEAIRSGASKFVELLYPDLKAAIKSVVANIQRRVAAEKAQDNIEGFYTELDDEVHHLISVGVSDDGYERIVGNLDDPDFVYIVNKATEGAARTSDTSKHKLLARMVGERLQAKSESTVSLVMAQACEKIPNLTHRQLLFLGLSVLVHHIRPVKEVEENVDEYTKWLIDHIVLFQPIQSPTITDVQHLMALSCMAYDPVSFQPWESLLRPRRDVVFDWPKNFLEENSVISQLREVELIQHSTFTTIGSALGTFVYDLKSGQKTEFLWD